MSNLGETNAQLADRTMHELRLEWRRHHRGDPPECFSRDLLLRALAYKLQERALGGLSQTAKRRLTGMGRTSAAAREGDRQPGVTLKPGVRLVREWRGEVHAVLVLENGFNYRDQRYRSLTQIAKLITGAHWSGPRFFGLVQTGARPVLTAGLAMPADRAGEGHHGQA